MMSDHLFRMRNNTAMMLTLFHYDRDAIDLSGLLCA